jgi:Holliday junction DNA helicase RuvB
MNFQKLFGPLTWSREDRFFNDIIGHEHIKRLFGLALRSEGPIHILLSGPPASAKTMFLLSLRQHLRNSYFVDGGNTTKAGIIDYLFKNRPRYLLAYEIDKMSPRDQASLLNLMENGMLSETKYGRTRQAEIKTSVFATSNDPRKLSVPLQSRFFIVELELYTYEQFYKITLCLLDAKQEIARIIADAVWNTSRNLRDCVRIGKLARMEEDVKFLVAMLDRHREDVGIPHCAFKRVNSTL